MKAWLNMHKNKSARTTCLHYSARPGRQIFHMETQYIILFIIYILVLFWLKIFFTLTNSEDPDEMQQYEAFHLGFHCLQKYSLRGFPNTKG